MSGKKMRLRQARRRDVVNGILPEFKSETKSATKPVPKVSVYRSRVKRDRTRFDPEAENLDKMDHMMQVDNENWDEIRRPCRAKWHNRWP